MNNRALVVELNILRFCLLSVLNIEQGKLTISYSAQVLSIVIYSF